MVNEEIEKKYEDVHAALETALKKANSIELTGTQENEELNEIRKTLESLNNNLKTEVEKLKSSSEWDKLCIAFFGETNAGKSTIIDSLRIVYDEETRRNDISAQQREYFDIAGKHCEEYEKIISSLREVNAELDKKQKLRVRLSYIFSALAGAVLGLIIVTLGIIIW